MAKDENKRVGLGGRVFSGLIAIGLWEAGKLMYRSRREDDLADEFQDEIDEEEDE